MRLLNAASAASGETIVFCPRESRMFNTTTRKASVSLSSTGSVQFQGRINEDEAWIDIGSSITSTSGVELSPWPQMRATWSANAGTITIAIQTFSDDFTLPIITAASGFTGSVDEDLADDTVIETFSVILPGNNPKWRIVTGNTDLFEINSSGELTLVTGANLDYELANEHSILIEVSDGGSTDVASTYYVLTVNDVTE